MKVGAAERAEYAREGFARLGRLLDDAEADRLAAALAEALGPDPERSAYGVLRNNLWRASPVFEALVRDGRLAAAARDLLSLPEVVLFQDNVIWKTPGTTARVEWHQDYAYWPLASPEGTTLWLALDDAGADNGCMRFVRGTHLLGERCPTDFVAGTGQPRRPDLPPLAAAEREHEAVAAPLAKGELLAHHPLVWHMSPPNLSARHRRAYSLTWILPGARWDPAHAPHPFNYQLRPRAGDPVEGERFPRFR